MSMATETSRVLFINRTIVDNETQDEYTLRQKIGSTSVSTVFRAQYEQKNQNDASNESEITHVALKVIPRKAERACMEMQNHAMNRTYGPGDHPNIIGFKNLFESDGLLLFAMEDMDQGSLRYIVSQKFKNGMPEDFIAVALREAVRGLCFIHQKGRVHGTFSSGDIFVHQSPTAIKLAADQVTSYKHDPSGGNVQNFDHIYHRASSTAPEAINAYTIWTSAPEVYNSNTGRGNYTKAADIWLVGVTALELAYGGLHVTGRESFEAIITEILKKNKLPRRDKFIDVAKGVKLSKGKKVLRTLGMKLKALKSSKGKNQTQSFSDQFEEMVFMCLTQPRNRPTAEQLLQCDFLRKAKDLEHFKQRVLNVGVQIYSA